MRMPDEPQSTLIMKELSDIKEKLATNTAETGNVKATVNDIKNDLRTIQQSFVTHDEFKTQQKNIADTMKVLKDVADDHEKRTRSLEGSVWKAIGALAILQFVIPLVAKYFL